MVKGVAQQEQLGPFFHGEWFCLNEQNRQHNMYIYILMYMSCSVSEEECEDMAREIRNTCKCEDGRVKFDDFVAMLA